MNFSGSFSISESRIDIFELSPKYFISELLKSNVCPEIVIDFSEDLNLSISTGSVKLTAIIVPPTKSILNFGPLLITREEKPIIKKKIEINLVILVLLIKSKFVFFTILISNTQLCCASSRRIGGENSFRYINCSKHTN